MKENQPQEGEEGEGGWPVEGDSRFPVFDAVPSQSRRGNRRRRGGGGLRGRERQGGSVGKREASANQGGEPAESLKGSGQSSSKGSRRSSSVPPLEGRAKANSWAEAGDKFQVFEAVPGRRQSRSDSGRGRAARLEPMVGGEGVWPQPGNPTFPVYPAVPGVEEGGGAALKGFQVFEAVPGKEEPSN